MYCPNCKKEVGEDDRFCPECGTRTIAQQRCANCGEPLEPGMLFCPECGQAVGGQNRGQDQREERTAAGRSFRQEEDSGKYEQQPAQQRDAGREKYPYQRDARQGADPGRYEQQPAQRTAGEKRKLPAGALLGICAGVLVIAAGVFALTQLRSGDSEKQEGEPETVQVQEEGTEEEAQEETQEEAVVITPEISEVPDASSNEVVTVLGDNTQEEEQEEAQEIPKSFEGAKEKAAQQEVVTAGGQLDLQHMGNLLANAGATYGTYVLDITNQQEYDGGGAESPLPASALIGVPILFTIADGVDKGEIDLNTPVTFHYTFENGRGSLTSAADGYSLPISQLLSEALTNSDNNALNSLMDFLTLEKINDTCHSYGFTSVDMQRKLISGSSDLENYISAKDAAMMLNAIYQDNFTGIGKSFLELNFKISSVDTANRGMYPACVGCDTFLNLNGITDSRYNEIGLIQNGDEVFILSVFTCNGEGTVSAAALTTLTSYVVSTLQAQ